jgi:MoaA/NifB/PqqE/SkfB family radical SAM enzyme
VKERPFSEIWSAAQNDGRLPRLRDRCADCRFKEVCCGGVRALQKCGTPGAEVPGCYLRDYEIATAEAAA